MKENKYYRKYFTQEDIASMFHYSSTESFRNSSARNRILNGISRVIKAVEYQIVNKITDEK